MHNLLRVGHTIFQHSFFLLKRIECCVHQLKPQAFAEVQSVLFSVRFGESRSKNWNDQRQLCVLLRRL